MLKFVDYTDINRAKSFESLTEFKTLHSLPDSNPVALIDKSLKLVYVNQSFSQIFNLHEDSHLCEIESVPDIEGAMLGLLNSNYSNISVDLFLPTLEVKNLLLMAERILIGSAEYVILAFNTIQQKINLESRINSLHQALEYSNIPTLHRHLKKSLICRLM